nr:hypothetical protein [Anaerolineae bacterium]
MAISRVSYSNPALSTSAGATTTVPLNVGTGPGRFVIAFMCGENACGSFIRENSTTTNDFTKVLIDTCQGYYYRAVTGTGTVNFYVKTGSTYEQVHFACYQGVDTGAVAYLGGKGFVQSNRSWSENYSKNGFLWAGHGMERGQENSFSVTVASGVNHLSSRCVGTCYGSRGAACDRYVSGSGSVTMGWSGFDGTSYGTGPSVFLPEKTAGGNKIFGGVF